MRVLREWKRDGSVSYFADVTTAVWAVKHAALRWADRAAGPAELARRLLAGERFETRHSVIRRE